jgi:hypothetical protein
MIARDTLVDPSNTLDFFIKLLQRLLQLIYPPLFRFPSSKNSFPQVEIFVRRDLDLQHEKLKIHVIDFDKPEQWNHLVNGDVLFSCLGTTLKVAGSKEAQWKIDYDYQYEFAKSPRKIKWLIMCWYHQDTPRQAPCSIIQE